MGGVELDGLVAAIALLLPVCALLTVIVLATRARRSGKHDRPKAPPPPQQAAPVAAPLATPAPPSSAQELAGAPVDAAQVARSSPHVPAPAPPAAASPSPRPVPAATPPRDEAAEAAAAAAARAAEEARLREARAEAARRQRVEVDGAIEAASNAKAEDKLASLLLQRARLTVEDGRPEVAAEELRSSIRLSARLGLKDVHAAARIELGDIARAAGDLTTACEHWQIARGLFYELKRAEQLAGAETRMRQNGCPTDWVLNDF